MSDRSSRVVSNLCQKPKRKTAKAESIWVSIGRLTRQRGLRRAATWRITYSSTLSRHCIVDALLAMSGAVISFTASIAEFQQRDILRRGRGFDRYQIRIDIDQLLISDKRLAISRHVLARRPDLRHKGRVRHWIRREPGSGSP